MAKELEEITNETYTIVGHEQIEFVWKGLDVIGKFINKCEGSDKVNSNFALGSLYTAFNEEVSAAKSFKESLKYAGEEQKGYLLYKMGTVLLLEQFPMSALPYLNTSLDKIQGNSKLKAKALVNLGAAYEDIIQEKKDALIRQAPTLMYKLIAKAKENYEKALRINPPDEKAKFNLWRLNNKGLPNEKEDNWLFNLNGGVREINTLEEEIRKCYNSETPASKKKAVEEVLGTLYLLASKDKKADEHFQTALNNANNKALTSYNIGTAYSIKGMFDKAREYLFESLRNKPNKTTRIKALNGLSSIYIQNGETETAMRVVYNVRRLDPNDEKSLFNLGEIEKDKGRREVSVPTQLRDGILTVRRRAKSLSPQGLPHQTNKSIMPYLSNLG